MAVSPQIRLREIIGNQVQRQCCGDQRTARGLTSRQGLIRERRDVPRFMVTNLFTERFKACRTVNEDIRGTPPQEWVAWPKTALFRHRKGAGQRKRLCFLSSSANKDVAFMNLLICVKPLALGRGAEGGSLPTGGGEWIALR